MHSMIPSSMGGTLFTPNILPPKLGWSSSFNQKWNDEFLQNIFLVNQMWNDKFFEGEWTMQCGGILLLKESCQTCPKRHRLDQLVVQDFMFDCELDVTLYVSIFFIFNFFIFQEWTLRISPSWNSLNMFVDLWSPSYRMDRAWEIRSWTDFWDPNCQSCLDQVHIFGFHW